MNVCVRVWLCYVCVCFVGVPLCACAFSAVFSVCASV